MNSDVLEEQADSMTGIVEALVRCKPNCIKPSVHSCISLKMSKIQNIDVSDAVSDCLSKIKMIL